MKNNGNNKCNDNLNYYLASEDYHENEDEDETYIPELLGKI